jgi:Flp pilus assembly protein CpaB
MKTWTIVVLLVLGIAAAICAAVLVGSYEFLGKDNLEARQLLIMNKDLPMDSELGVEDVNEFKVADASYKMPHGSFRYPHQISGRVLLENVKKGQTILTSHLIGVSDAEFASRIPQGEQATTLSVSQESIIGGFIYPGCRVNIFSVFTIKGESRGEAVAAPILQAVKVIAKEDEFLADDGELAADRAVVNKKNRIRITFSLDNEGVQRLELARLNGDIQLTLRNPKDEGISKASPTTLKQMDLWGESLDLADPVVPDQNDIEKKGPKKVIIIKGRVTEVVGVGTKVDEEVD